MGSRSQFVRSIGVRGETKGSPRTTRALTLAVWPPVILMIGCKNRTRHHMPGVHRAPGVAKRQVDMHRSVDKLLEANRSAVASFQLAARSISADAWQSPIAPGKWTPAPHVEHIALSYGAAVLDLVHGKPMRLVGTPRSAGGGDWLASTPCACSDGFRTAHPHRARSFRR